MTRSLIVLVTAEHAIFLRNANGVVYRGECLHLLDRQCGGISDQVNLGQHLLRTLHTVHTHLDVRKILQVIFQTFEFA